MTKPEARPFSGGADSSGALERRGPPPFEPARRGVDWRRVAADLAAQTNELVEQLDQIRSQVAATRAETARWLTRGDML